MARPDDDGETASAPVSALDATQASADPLDATQAPADPLDATLPSASHRTARPATTTAPGDAPRPSVDGLTAIGRFEIQRKLGEGGMGVVYLATDPTLGRRVAIKILHRDGGDPAAARRRLLREAQGTAQLAHEHVVVVHEVGTHEEHVFLAMEYVPGTTLKAWQVGRGWREVLAMYRRAGQGLHAAHAVGLVHRDFKPDNVLVGDDGRVRVTDFGLVAAVDELGLDLSHDAATLRGELDLAVSMTRTGTILGTPRYMAPEQHRGELVDARADQFAFCVALYEAWYQHPPFAGHSYEALLANVLAGEVRPVPASAEVPAALRDAVLRGLQRQRDARFASMQELLAALVEPTATPSAAPRRRRWPWRLGLVAGGVAAVATTALVIGAGRGAPARPRDALDGEIAALRDPTADRARRVAAVAALAASTDERAGQALMAAMRGDADPGVRAAAARAVEAAAVQIATSLQPAPTAPAERPWARGVSADDQRAALALFNEGNTLLRAGEYREAAARYRAALPRWDHPAIQFNLALALVDEDQPVELQRALAAAMRYGAAPLDEDKFARAQALASLVAKQVTQLEFATQVAGRTLILDGEDVFTGPGRFQRAVAAGRHTWALRVGARTSPPRTVVLAGGVTEILPDDVDGP
ncbi:MAG: serine/threonine protein kinase [Myxococcales bacterium]|nr:serine/threonine protein kinase [Myxococcales bacterium]